MKRTRLRNRALVRFALRVSRNNCRAKKTQCMRDSGIFMSKSFEGRFRRDLNLNDYF